MQNVITLGQPLLGESNPRTGEREKNTVNSDHKVLCSAQKPLEPIKKLYAKKRKWHQILGKGYLVNRTETNENRFFSFCNVSF